MSNLVADPGIDRREAPTFLLKFIHCHTTAGTARLLCALDGHDPSENWQI